MQIARSLGGNVVMPAKLNNDHSRLNCLHIRFLVAIAMILLLPNMPILGLCNDAVTNIRSVGGCSTQLNMQYYNLDLSSY